jgi:L-asparaginase
MTHAKPALKRLSSKYPSSPFGEKEPGIPTGRDVDWEPLVDYRRNGVSENTIHGAISWYSGGDLIHSFGGNVLCYGRSMMKLFYIRAFQKELAHLNWKQKAISVSSHNGTAEHVEAAQSLLSESEWGLMKTPLDLPLVQFGRQVRRPRRWYNNSSGHHAALLLACRLKGINRAAYTLPSHPVFKEYMRVVRESLGDPNWQPLKIARDGDGLPTVSMTVKELAKCYAHLAKTRHEDWIWEAMIREPDLVGGYNRLDTTIMKSCGGRVIAKEGADGLLGMAIDHPDYKDGLGIVIKIAHGWNPQATWYVARGVLGVLGFELRNPYPLRRQKAFLVPGIVPEKYLSRLAEIPTWDEWDPDHDRWYSL